MNNKFTEAIEIAEELSDKLFIPRISRDDGVVLYTIISLLTDSSSRITALDAGAGVGYSTLWIISSLEDQCVNSVVYAVERDRLRYEYLKKILGSLNTSCVKIMAINEDATEFIRRYERQDLNFIFVDIDKGQYEYFFEEARKRIIRGGVIAFHNAYVVHRFVSKLIDSGYKVVIVPTGEGILLVRFT